jgi:aryl carrier-like protein
MELDTMIAEHATAAFEDSTPLLQAGLESLSILRLVVAVATNDSAEIDGTRLAQLRVVGDLKLWLTELAAS